MELYTDSTMMNKVQVELNGIKYYGRFFITYSYCIEQKSQKSFDIPEPHKVIPQEVIEVSILDLYHVDLDGLHIKDSIYEDSEVCNYIHDNKTNIFLNLINC